MRRSPVDRHAVLITACLFVSACQSSSPSGTDMPDSSNDSPSALEDDASADPSTDSTPDTREPMQDDVDYTGSWMTGCMTINPTQSDTVRLSLDDGEYRLERYVYDGQGCGAEEDSIFPQIETGGYEIVGPAEVPSGVLAHEVRLTARERTWDGEAIDISDEQPFLDLLHRAGDVLYRARPNRVGVAGVQFSEELDFSVEYFLQQSD